MPRTRMKKKYCSLIFILFHVCFVTSESVENCTVKEHLACTLYKDITDCSPPSLEARFTFMRANDDSWPGTASSFKDITEGTGTFTFTPPTDSSIKDVKGFVVMLTRSDSTYPSCYVFDLSKATWKNGSEDFKTDFTLTLFSMKRYFDYILDLYTLPRSPKDKRKSLRLFVNGSSIRSARTLNRFRKSLRSVIDCSMDHLPMRTRLLPAMSNTTNLHGSQFTFECLGGYDVIGWSEAGDNTFVCKKDGKWSIGTLYCQARLCSDPGSPADGRQSATNYEVGGTVHFECNRDGYAPDPVDHIQCVYDSVGNKPMWDGVVPVCRDVTPPKFHYCPKKTIYQYFGWPVSYREPFATDNSGPLRNMTTDNNFRPGDILHGPETIIYKAIDHAGLTANCTVTLMTHAVGTNNNTFYRVASIKLTVMEEVREVRIAFTLPPKHNFTMFIVILENIRGGAKQKALIRDTEHTFKDVVSGVYQITVQPKQEGCGCRLSKFYCGACLKGETKQFAFGLATPSISKQQKQTTTNVRKGGSRGTEGVNTVTVVLAVIGVVLLVILGGLFAFCYIRKRTDAGLPQEPVFVDPVTAQLRSYLDATSQDAITVTPSMIADQDWTTYLAHHTGHNPPGPDDQHKHSQTRPIHETAPTQDSGKQFYFIPPDDMSDFETLSKTLSEQMMSINARNIGDSKKEYDWQQDLALLRVQNEEIPFIDS